MSLSEKSRLFQGGKRRSACLLLIVALSLALNLLGIWWGQYHPDDFTSHALYMLKHGTLRPSHLWYPTLFTYVVLLFSVIPSKAAEILLFLSSGHDFQSAVSMVGVPDITRPTPGAYMGPRILTALIGTCGVYIAYRLGRFFSTAGTGLLAALLLSVSMGYATNAHFATADVPVTVMMLLSFWMCLRAGRKRTAGSCAVAALTIGLAASVKYYGILMIFPYALVCWSVCRSRPLVRRRLPLFLVVVVLGFIAGTPHSIFSFFSFMKDVLQLNLLTPHMKIAGTSPPHGYLTQMKNLVNIMGAPLFFAAAASLLYSLHVVLKGKKFELACIWAFILPFYLIVGRLRVAPARYILPVVPFLLLIAAHTFDGLLHAGNGTVRRVSRVVLAAVVLYSCMYTVAGDFHLILDSKRKFLAWAGENVPGGATIELTTYCPMPRDGYSAYYQPHAGGNDRYYSLLRDSGLYRFALRQGIIWKHLATKWRMPGEEIIDRSMGYFFGKEVAVISVRPDADFDYSLKGLYERAPDYLVINHYYGGRFTGNRSEYPSQHEFYTALFHDSDPVYRRVAAFSPPRFFLLNPRVQFADDYISVYTRTAGPARRNAL